MKNGIITFLILLIFNISTAFCQFSRFTKQGSITFEKTINMYTFLKPESSDDTFQQLYYDKFRSTNPQFVKLNSTLIFNENKSLFTPVWEENSKIKSGFSGITPAQINEVYTDYSTSNFTTLKKVFEEDFIVKDSVRKINWKITTEVRDIAGYNCRRANAIIMDSVYVIAFYTDEIPFSGGPESFTGLPGMILGVVLPREHLTWFATKVTDVPIPEKNFIIPNKGKPTNLMDLKKKILDAGKYYEKGLKSFLL